MDGLQANVCVAGKGVDNDSVLMETFIEACINLPPVSVCNGLRTELVKQGFINHVKSFISVNVPDIPPPWSPALLPKMGSPETKVNVIAGRKDIITKWRLFYLRSGLPTAFRILIGLCSNHALSQDQIADITTNCEHLNQVTFLMMCHWIENTSNRPTECVSTNGLGILAETLLDTLMENNEPVRKKVRNMRELTRKRKKEIAEDRRNKALVGMSSFGPFTGSLEGSVTVGEHGTARDSNTSRIRSFSGSLLASKQIGEDGITTVRPDKNKNDKSKPAWLTELECMKDETGLTCAVCQEGSTLQPSEPIGLYTFIKKVSIPGSHGGSRGCIDGTMLLASLPLSLPRSLEKSDIEKRWYRPARAAAEAIKGLSSSSCNSRHFTYSTTVTAGNAIHCSCHAKARTVDKNHPKAPKNEWEGASLRNSRISCNAILPVMLTRNPLVSTKLIDRALADHQSCTATVLGSRPKSMLWTILHDVRLLMLRISYGETLNVDCCGGSLSSNSSLILYTLLLVHKLAKDTKQKLQGTIQHIKELSSGYLAAFEIVSSKDLDRKSVNLENLQRSIADVSPMAAISSIIFFNTTNEDTISKKTSPSDVQRWKLYKDRFLSGLVQCAGRRYALGIDGSGCESNGGSNSVRRNMLPRESNDKVSLMLVTDMITKSESIDKYFKALKPMITLYAMLDQLSKDFSHSMEDKLIEERADQITRVIELCQRTDNIRSLLHHANVLVDEQKVLETFLEAFNRK